VFQLFSHKALYDDNGADIQQTKGYEGQNPWLQLRLYRRKNAKHVQPSLPAIDEETASNLTAPARGTDLEHRSTSTEDTDSEIESYMSIPVSLGLLVVVTVVRAAACADNNHLKLFSL
jgi:Ca2+:H+ antiporter